MKTTRNTIQRELVLSAVLRMKNHHPTADEIYSEVCKEHPAISKGTVYRNLNMLVESGAIRRVALPDGADRFDFEKVPHYHIRCTKCGRVFDVDMPYQKHCAAKSRTCTVLWCNHMILFSGHLPCMQSIKKTLRKEGLKWN